MITDRDHSVPMSLQAAVTKIPLAGWLIKNRHLFLTVWRLRSPDQVTSTFSVWGRISTSFTEGHPCPVSSRWWEGRKKGALWGLFNKGTNSISGEPPPQPDHLSEAPPPNTFLQITLGVRLLCMNLGGRAHTFSPLLSNFPTQPCHHRSKTGDEHHLKKQVCRERWKMMSLEHLYYVTSVKKPNIYGNSVAICCIVAFAHMRQWSTAVQIHELALDVSIWKNCKNLEENTDIEK